MILDEITFDLKKGGFYFLIGPSGCGKTTILKLIHLLEAPNSGKIFINDKSLSSKTNLVKHRSQIGYVYQDYRLADQKTAEFNIKIPLYISNFRRKLRKELFEQTVKNLGIQNLLKQPVEILSGGEKQLVSIARAIVTKPKILLVDEPSAHLDRKSALRILNILLGIRALGITILLATHDLELIKATENSKILLLDKGKISLRQN